MSMQVKVKYENVWLKNLVNRVYHTFISMHMISVYSGEPYTNYITHRDCIDAYVQKRRLGI